MYANDEIKPIKFVILSWKLFELCHFSNKVFRKERLDIYFTFRQADRPFITRFRIHWNLRCKSRKRKTRWIIEACIMFDINLNFRVWPYILTATLSDNFLNIASSYFRFSLGFVTILECSLAFTVNSQSSKLQLKVVVYLNLTWSKCC